MIRFTARANSPAELLGRGGFLTGSTPRTSVEVMITGFRSHGLKGDDAEP
jgi:hypothetical protein